MIHNLTRAGKAALLAIALFVPTESFAAYTCSNPAICIAVCGRKTCGRVSSTNADMKMLDAGRRMSSGKQSKAKPYTCSNPAICIAVCGKKTCG